MGDSSNGAGAGAGASASKYTHLQYPHTYLRPDITQ